MNPFKRLRQAVASAAQRIRSFFRPQKPPQQTAGQRRQQLMQDAEQKASQQALWAIQNAINNPQDKTAQEGRRKAVEYLNRAEQLKKRGKLQDWNRQQMAERWLQSDLASERGQQDRKEKKLEVFNQNFNIDLNEEQADMLADLMQSDTYQQLAETYEGIYGDIIQAMGEAIDVGTDPLKLERSMNLFINYQLQPDFNSFRQVLYLSEEEFNSLEMELLQSEDSIFVKDDIEKLEQREAILGRYIFWE